MRCEESMLKSASGGPAERCRRRCSPGPAGGLLKPDRAMRMGVRGLQPLRVTAKYAEAETSKAPESGSLCTDDCIPWASARDARGLAGGVGSA